MSDILDPLVCDLVEWIAKEPRSHAEVIDAWRTSCPRLTVWEEATERGLVTREFVPGRGAMVVVTEAGRRLLRRDRSGRPMPVQSTAAP
jgi:hypothetical protein